MQGPPTPLSVLGPQVEAERQRIRQQFEAGTSARETLRALCELADRNVQRVFGELLHVHESAPQGLALLALGGYGRQMLFPYSDLDILFLFGSEKAELESRRLIAEFSRTLWDLGFRVSSAGRTLEECKRIEEDNAEFHLALLDRRFLAGVPCSTRELDVKFCRPQRGRRAVFAGGASPLDRERLTRYATRFSSEPNVKESPGGMRDYQATSGCGKSWRRKRGRRITAAEEELSRLRSIFSARSDVSCITKTPGTTTLLPMNCRLPRQSAHWAWETVSQGRRRNGCACTSVMLER
jgi:[protein-PII] uridylyltransferase